MEISVKNRKIFPPPCILCPRWRVPRGIRYWCWGWKTRVWPTKKFDDNFSHVDRMHQCDRRTDTRWQQRPHLHIASRIKNAVGEFQQHFWGEVGLVTNSW